MNQEERKEFIHSKGFDMAGGTKEYSTAQSEFKKVKVGVKTLEDAVLDLDEYIKVTKRTSTPPHPFRNKREIMRAMFEKDTRKIRAISDFFYKTNGIYSRVVNYFAFLYRFDWYIAPEVYDKTIGEKKILDDFNSVLNYFDNSHIKMNCGEIALKVIKDGCYYGYITDAPDGVTIQELPIDYCRTRYTKGCLPIVEFDMSYFDTFRDVNYRMKIINVFPDEFKKGYMLFKQGKLQPDFFGDVGKWYMLEPESCVKFNINGSDTPLFVNAIPALIDLDEIEELDKRKQMQQLLKIIVQKLPMDKNGDLIFDVDEARDIHNNAVQMLIRAIGTDVLTTFADVQAIDMSNDSMASASSDSVESAESRVYSAFGVSENLFNTDGNLSLEKSILSDESTLRNLLLQFEIFYDRICQQKSSKKNKYNFKFYMLETTQYNYREMAKMYKEQTQIGYSKMLPQVALGHTQSFILNSINFENNFLHLSEIMIPPLTSNTLSMEDIKGTSGQSNSNNNQKSQTSNNSGTSAKQQAGTATSDKEVGRPEKSDDQKSEKTIQNKESMS